MKLAEKGGLKLLPREYSGSAPEWPLTYTSTRQQELWEVYWKKPQARIWADQQMEHEVAIHVQTLVEAETPNAPTSTRTLLLQQMNSLLLTQPSLLKAGYRVATDEDATPTTKTTTAKPRASSRARLRAVPDVGPGS
ncbi:MAG: hypothetical protein ABIQ01_05715 [Pseudolysinimonas sp.]